MASSEVEIVSSSPFACVLRDRNRRNHCRENNAKATAFQKNLNELAREHFQNCISVSSADENSGMVDSGIGKEQENNHSGKFLSKNQSRINGNNRSDDDFLIVSSTQSRILERRAARQAQKMVSSMEKQSQEAEQLASSSSCSSESTISSSSKREKQQNLPVESENCSEIGNLGASSLVQIWEARLNRSNSTNKDVNPVSTSSRSSSGICNNGNVDEHSRESEMVDYVNERYDTQPNHGDSFVDWESEPPTLSQGRNSDDGESERVRIADIIKKLASSSDDNDHEPGTNVCELTSRENRYLPVTDHPELREPKILSQVISSPKIRGRQAFADLLMQLERERHMELESLVERRAVSRFAHRGRIQSMLRIKFLHRRLANQDQQRSQSAVSPEKLSRGPSIIHLRKKFSTSVDCRAAVQIEATTSPSHYTEIANNTVRLQNSSSSNRIGEDGRNQEATNTGAKGITATENFESQTSKDHQKESIPRTDVTLQGTTTTFLDPQGTGETTTLLNGQGRRSGIAQDQGANHRHDIYCNSKRNSESTPSFDGRNKNKMAEQQNGNDQQHLYIDSHETAETTAVLNGWEENEQDEEQNNEWEYYSENYYDWISEISRPRSFWEDRRQTWYQEVLSNDSENEEIRQLLERKRVSTFLASDFRETMDQLMTSRVQRQTELEDYREEEQEEISQEKIRELLLSRLQRRMHPTVSQEEEPAEGDQAEQVEEQAVKEEDEDDDGEDQEEEDEGDEEQEEEEEEEDDEVEEGPSLISHPFQEASDYFDLSSTSMKTSSPSIIRTWSYRDREVGDDSDPVASTSPQPLPAQVYYQESRQSSSPAKRLSIEAELIYDLRGQIEQLHREISELRKSIESCVAVQVKLQLSNQPEVQSVRVAGNSSLDGAPKKRSCCICSEMQVDSLLYRCGHMCTCIKCARKLQWSSGKCPICRAPILDVVQAFMDS